MWLTFIACDGDNGTSSIPNGELELSPCLAEDLFQACNRYICEEIGPAEFPAAIIPPDSFLGEECVALGCETIFCGLVSYNELRIRSVDGFPGIFGVFFPDIENLEPVEFGPCEFE